MRIAFFHELPAGGARIAVNEIAQRLNKKHKVDLYYTDEVEDEGENKNFKKVYFYKFIPKKWSGGDFKTRIYKDTLELYKLNKLHKRIAADIDKRKYDLVFVNASKFIEAPFILSFLKTKKVFYLHDPHFRMIYEAELDDTKKLDPIRRTYEKQHKFFLKVFDKQNISHADYLIANSNYTKSQTYKSYKMKSEVKYLGVDDDFFTPSKRRKIIDVLYIGSKSYLDGYHLLQQALKLMEHQPKIRLIFKETEWVSREKMKELYRRSKVVLALGINEPFGLIPIEAAASGVPVIALDEGGYRETIIDGKTGYLIKKNPKDLANVLTQMLSRNKKTQKMGEDAKKWISDNWTWDKRIKELENYLQQVIEK